MNIWLDDIRQAPQGWIHVHNLDELEVLVKAIYDELAIDVMSFDYHLSHPKKGIDVMKYLVALCSREKTRRFWPSEIRYHTNDPEGEEEMRNFAENFNREMMSES